MKYYSINKGHPTLQLPSRIRLPDATTKTDLESYTDEELKEFGIEVVDAPPSFSEWYKRANWYETEWRIEDISSDEKAQTLNEKWIAIRKQRDTFINECSYLVEKYDSEIRREVTPTINISKVDEYIEKLRQIPQEQTDPFSIVWPSLDYKV
tara:strand:+ start:434 stop:889 length:456 start_codon:yes stop_codon:yes gene_type:complete